MAKSLGMSSSVVVMSISVDSVFLVCQLFSFPLLSCLYLICLALFRPPSITVTLSVLYHDYVCKMTDF